MGNTFACCSSDDKFQSHKYSCYMSDFEKRVYPLIDHIKLQKYQRSILKKRFAKLVLQYEELATSVVWRYNLCRIVISIGSMILPTLQTIQDSANVSDYKNYIYWSAIGTSLSVMTSNNLISMFELDKKYIMYCVTAEKLKSLGWKYFELSDMFAGKSHSDNWITFWNEIENIKKMQMLAEYSSHDDKASNNNNDDDDNNKKSITYDSDIYSSDSDDNPSPKKHHTKHHKTQSSFDIEAPPSIEINQQENQQEQHIENAIHNIKDELIDESLKKVI